MLAKSKEDVSSENDRVGKREEIMSE